MFFKRCFTVLLLLVMVVSVTMLACSDDKKKDSAAEDDDFARWFSPSNAWTFQYRIFEWGYTFDGVGEIMGFDTETYPGETYLKIRYGVFREDGVWRGSVMWVDLSDFGKVKYKAAEVYYGNLEAEGKPGTDPVWDFKEEFTPPLEADLSLDVGEEHTASSTFRMYFNGSATPDTEVPITLTCVISDDNVTVTVPKGTITGCYKLDMIATGEGGGFNGTQYLHPDYGLVKSELIPGFQKVELIEAAGIAKFLAKLH